MTVGHFYAFMKASKLLISEPPLQLLPTLAVLIGVNEAIVVQQLDWLLKNPKSGKVLSDGHKYVYNTYEEWRETFPFWSERTIQRIFLELEERKIVVSYQPDGVVSRRKYYRLDFDQLERLQADSEHAKLAPSGTCQLDLIRNMPSWHLPLTETSAKTSSENTPTPAEPKKERQKNENLEALVMCYYGRLDGVAKSGWSFAQSALKEIEAVHPGLTPNEIRRRWANLKLRFNGESSPKALVKWWPQCDSPPALPALADRTEKPRIPENLRAAGR